MKKVCVSFFFFLLFPSFLQAGLFDAFRSGKTVEGASNPVSFDQGDCFRLDKTSNLPKMKIGIFEELTGLFSKKRENNVQPVDFRLDWQQDGKPTKVFALFRPQSESISRYVDYGTEEYATVCRGKNRIAAAAFAILLGGFGVHKYYLGETRMGVIYTCVSVLSCFILYPLVHLVGIVEGILYLLTPEEQFHRKYCRHQGCVALAKW